MNTAKFLLLGFFVIIFSCKGDEDSIEIIKPILEDAKFLDLKEVFDEISYVYLSPREDTGYIKEIEQLQYNGTDFYIFQDEAHSPSIFKFNKNGQLVFHETSKEEGPGKFIGANDIVLNNSEGVLEILDAYQSKIVHCSTKDCSYIKEEKLPNNFRQFVQLEGNNYAFYTGNEPTEHGAFNVYLKNTEEQQVRPFAAIPSFLINTIYENNCFSSFPFNNTYLYRHEFSNIIWKVSNDNVRQVYQVDFGEIWFDEKALYGLAQSDVEGKMSILNSGDDKIRSLRNLEEFDDHLFFHCYGSGKLYWNFYEKNKRELKSFYIDRASLERPNNFDGGPMPMTYRGRYNEYMIFEAESELVHTLGKNAAASSKFKQFAHTVPEEGNPVIILAKLNKKYQ